ncbi:MAG: hypothetical protein SGILL_003641 [Bacillariaceae sp.]
MMMMEENDNIKVEVKMDDIELTTRKDPPPPPALAFSNHSATAKAAAFGGASASTKSKKDIKFTPGTATLVYGDGNGTRNGAYGDDVDDLEAKVAKKMMKEGDLKKYHKSFEKATPPKKFFPDEATRKRDFYIVAMCMLTLVFGGLVAYGFVSGLFLPKDDASSPPSTPTVPYAERQAYMEELMEFLQLGPLEPSSPQEQALEWMAFQDDPLPVPLSPDDAVADVVYLGIRLEQRYALTVWYFAQGGPKLWSTINRDTGGGWMNHGVGVHECDWHAVDCEVLDDDDGFQDDARVVVGLRLNNGVGVVLTGTSLSTELGMLTHLRRLDFSNQRLEGSIPDEWRALSNLDMLVLSKNVIQSTIPEWIGNSWTELKTLAIDGNLIEGTIPLSLMTMTKLRHIELQLNIALGGQFDELMRTIPELEHFDFSGTDLEGTIPTNPMPELRVFQSWNTEKLRGSIPTEIGLWQKLETFSLDANPNLEGTIVTEFGLLPELQTLQIKNTPVTGPLPTELGNLPNLKTLVLSILQLGSTLPLEYANIATLEKMDFLANPGLIGTVPTEYANLANLEYLDIAGTSLSGNVPSGICALELQWMTADCPGKNTNPNDLICECCTSCGGGNGGN